MEEVLTHLSKEPERVKSFNDRYIRQRLLLSTLPLKFAYNRKPR
jgi:hypothetical protein